MITVADNDDCSIVALILWPLPVKAMILIGNSFVSSTSFGNFLSVVEADSRTSRSAAISWADADSIFVIVCENTMTMYLFVAACFGLEEEE